MRKLSFLALYSDPSIRERSVDSKQSKCQYTTKQDLCKINNNFDEYKYFDNDLFFDDFDNLVRSNFHQMKEKINSDYVRPNRPKINVFKNLLQEFQGTKQQKARYQPRSSSNPALAYEKNCKAEQNDISKEIRVFQPRYSVKNKELETSLDKSQDCSLCQQKQRYSVRDKQETVQNPQIQRFSARDSINSNINQNLKYSSNFENNYQNLQSSQHFDYVKTVRIPLVSHQDSGNINEIVKTGKYSRVGDNASFSTNVTNQNMSRDFQSRDNSLNRLK